MMEGREDRRDPRRDIDLPPPPRRREPAIFRAGNSCIGCFVWVAGALIVGYAVTAPSSIFFPRVHGWWRVPLWVATLVLVVASALLYDAVRRRRRDRE